jgi:hypothetical protein
MADPKIFSSSSGEKNAPNQDSTSCASQSGQGVAALDRGDYTGPYEDEKFWTPISKTLPRRRRR